MGARFRTKGSVYAIEQNAEINVTPFVDVMLVLLIIFMVSIPVATKAIRLDMPPPDGTVHSDRKPVFISVMGPGRIFIGEHQTSLATLDADLRAALQSPNPLAERVLIRGDKDVQYADFMQVLNGLQQHGYLKVGLVNEDID